MINISQRKNNQLSKVRVDFSFKREVFFIVVASVVGAIVMILPKTLFEIEMGFPYYLTWIVYGHVIGIRSPDSYAIVAGMIIHLLIAVFIGIIAGIFLYKTNILNISKPSNGLRYGLLVGSAIFIVFTLPLQELLLDPEYAHDIVNSNISPSSSSSSSSYSHYTANLKEDYMLSEHIEHNRFTIIIGSLVMDMVFGVTLGLFSSILSIRYGARYRCPACNISFSRIDVLQNHLNLIHGDVSIDKKRILILGGGFAGVEVLKRLQDKFETDVRIDIRMVSKNNYFLFTPMLHEVASGMIETRHIVTPIRVFCNRSKFYAAEVGAIDLKNKQIIIKYTNSTATRITSSNSVGAEEEQQQQTREILRENNNDNNNQEIILDYDYLVISLGSETNFFGALDIKKNAFTIKSLDDAIKLRNHTIEILEQADLSQNNKELQKKLLTFVVVGGGFAGIETAAELNDFIHDSVKDFYHNIDIKDVRVVIVQSADRLLPEMNSNRLSTFALKKLSDKGVNIIFNKRAVGASEFDIKLNDGTSIPTKTIVWSTGVAPNPLLSSLPCEHDRRSSRIIVDQYLQVKDYSGVFAVGDCAYIIDPNTGNPYPPTAQHAVREGIVAAKNIIAAIEKDNEKNKEKKNNNEDGKEVVFDYKTKGIMVTIGKHNGVAILKGFEIQGFIAWWIWRVYYLSRLPTLQKKIRVMADWILDLLFKRDVTMLKSFIEIKEEQENL